MSEEEVLEFFRSELPVLGTLTGRLIPLQIDDALQSYAEDDDLVYAIDKYADHFSTDVSGLNFANYYPWYREWFFRRWFAKDPVKQVSKPLTVRMFAESAKAGRWLYD